MDGCDDLGAMHAKELEALEALYARNFAKSFALIDDLCTEYPEEGSLLIRRARILHECPASVRTRVLPGYETLECQYKEIHRLDNALNLIESGKSRYSMNKFKGLDELYLLRGHIKGKVMILAEKDDALMREYRDKALADYARCLAVDPEDKDAIQYMDALQADKDESEKSDPKRKTFVRSTANTRPKRNAPSPPNARRQNISSIHENEKLRSLFSRGANDKNPQPESQGAETWLSPRWRLPLIVGIAGAMGVLVSIVYSNSSPDSLLQWEHSCGSPPSPVLTWWPVLGPREALESVRTNYCGDAFLTAEGATQVASFTSEDEASKFAFKLSRSIGYPFRVGKPRIP